MALIDDVRMELRITSTDFDSEIQGLINSALADLKISGVADPLETDPLIKRAITIYCKAHFGYDNPEADRFLRAYDSLKMHLSLSAEYTGGTTSEA
ncbi:head-tail connector protein [Thermoactinomyces vulgaris]|jgi:hypothetical protein|uniref:head-tail connector protein n=1 Tax=Thermoactinomyces vulgaris TaxID=2026 RepID=UPI0036457D54